MACFSPRSRASKRRSPSARMGPRLAQETDAAKRLELLCSTLDSIETNANPLEAVHPRRGR